MGMTSIVTGSGQISGKKRIIDHLNDLPIKDSKPHPESTHCCVTMF